MWRSTIPARRRSAWRSGRRRLAGFLLAQYRLARQLDAVLIVDGDHLDLHDVADPADRVHLVHELVVQLADVAQTVPARQDLDERAEILDRRDLALVNLADANFLAQRLDLH